MTQVDGGEKISMELKSLLVEWNNCLRTIYFNNINESKYLPIDPVV